MKKYLLPEKGNYYKANLHSHSNLSDGKLSPEEMKALYKKRGYSVLAYTDHDMLIPHHDLTDEDFLALSGYEVEINQDGSPLKKSDKSCHICFIAKSPDIDIQPCWNEKYAHIGNAKINKDRVKYDKSLPPYERIYTPQCINDMIKKGRDAGFFVTYNHPVWSLENPEDYLKYEGINAMEILNYGCEVIGYNSYVPHIYNEMLYCGKKVFAVAADDNHNKFPEESPYCDSCGGFVMIKADSLKYEKITDALFKGNFYASSGPEIYDFYIENDEIYVSCSDAVMVTLTTGRRSSQIVMAPKGETVTKATFKLNREDIYLRITVKDANGKYADTNAYFLEDLI